MDAHSSDNNNNINPAIQQIPSLSSSSIVYNQIVRKKRREDHHRDNSNTNNNDNTTSTNSKIPSTTYSSSSATIISFGAAAKRLPDALLAHIMSFIFHFPYVLLDISLVSKRFHKIASGSPLVWRNVRFPYNTPSNLIASGRIPLSRETTELDIGHCHEIVDADLLFIAQRCTGLTRLWLPNPRRNSEVNALIFRRQQVTNAGNNPNGLPVVPAEDQIKPLPAEESYLDAMECSCKSLQKLTLECYSEKIVFRKPFPNLKSLTVNIHVADTRSFSRRAMLSYGSSGPFLRSFAQYCPALEHLDINTDDMENLNDDALALIGASCHQLKSLSIRTSSFRLSFNSISDNGVARLFEGLPHLESISFHRFPRVSANIFCSIARNCPKARDVILNYANAIGELQGDEVNDFEKFPIMRNLQALSITTTDGLTQHGLNAVIQRCPNLASLKIQSGRSNLGPRGLSIFGTLRQLAHLEIGFHPNNFDNVGLKAIFENCLELRTVRLCPLIFITGADVLDDETLTYIGNNSSKLVSLSICKCTFSAHGLQSLVDGCPELKEFSVRYGTWERSTVTTAITKTFPKLKKLSMSCVNNLDEEGIEQILQASPRLHKFNVILPDAANVSSWAVVSMVSKHCGSSIKTLELNFGSGIIPQAPEPSPARHEIQVMKRLCVVTICPFEQFNEKLLLLLMASSKAPVVSWWILMGLPPRTAPNNNNNPPALPAPPLFSRLFFAGTAPRSFHNYHPHPDDFLRKLSHEIIYAKGKGPYVKTLLHKRVSKLIYSAIAKYSDSATATALDPIEAFLAMDQQSVKALVDLAHSTTPPESWSSSHETTTTMEVDINVGKTIAMLLLLHKHDLDKNVSSTKLAQLFERLSKLRPAAINNASNENNNNNSSSSSDTTSGDIDTEH